MSTIDVPLARVAARSGQRLRVVASRPESWLDASAVVCWFALLLMWATASAVHDHAAGAGGETWPALARWSVMAGAMMLPLLVPQATMIARRGLWRRRHKAVAVFAAGYLAVWALVGLALIIVLGAVRVAGPGPVMVLLVAAAGWHCAAPRRAALRLCERAPTLAINGIRAQVDCLTAGVRAGGIAVWTCGPAMTAMCLTHGPVLAIGVSAALIAERRSGPNPQARIGSAAQAGWLVMLAGLVGLATGWPATASLV